MLQIKTFTFNPYQENTYLLYNEKGDALIIDPGMYFPEEQDEFVDFIESNNLKSQLLLNTHCHVDHVLGNRFVFDQYGLMPQFHEAEIPLLVEVQNYAPQMGFNYEVSPIPEKFLKESDKVFLGEDELSLILAPGHSPGHLCFYCKSQAFVIGGDVLFKNSIGRTDLPGGNHEQLLQSIAKKLYLLPDETWVYPGHGPETQIGIEKQTNPFIKG